MPDFLMLALVPVAFIIGSVVGARRSRLNWRDDLGLRAPTIRSALIAAGLFLILSIATEALYDYWGLADQASDWREKYELDALVLRVAFAALVYPIAEEIFFRGFVFGLIRRKAGEVAAIVGSALLFAILHFQYDWRGMLLVLIDGLFFGAVRSRTRSTLLTIALHIAGNSFAVWQRL